MRYSMVDNDAYGNTPLPFDDAFIAQWADELSVDMGALRNALVDAFDEFLDQRISRNYRR